MWRRFEEVELVKSRLEIEDKSTRDFNNSKYF